MPENNNPTFSNIEFDLPIHQSNVIKVIGVGGGGSNAVNHMLTQGINGVDFVVCNTDAQALQNSQVPTKIQLGLSLTEGLGAGANPEVGERSAEESESEVKDMLGVNTKMVFITAGMGGGTGTGAAPVIARYAKELDLLTIGIVTIPFSFEGKARNEQAQKGIEELRKYVDSMVVINNNKLREVYGNLGFKAGFSKADEVLATASRGIAEVITHHYTQNIDLKDAKTVLANSGTAIMGSAKASGKNRAEEAIMKALDSPLLNDNKIEGAKNVLLLIVSGTDEITIDEIGEINDYIQSEAKTNVNIIMGVGEDDALGDAIAVTVVATGFHIDQQSSIIQREPKKIIHTLDAEQKASYGFNEEEQFIAAPQEKIVHTLDLEEDSIDQIAIHKNEESLELISTSEFIKNIEVVYDEVVCEQVDEFIITSKINDIEVNDYEEIVASKENQVEFSFDTPATDIPIEITNDVNEIEVVNPIEVNPIAQEEIVFDLGDYNEQESKINSVKGAKKEEIQVEEELRIEVRNEPAQESEPQSEEEISPLHLTISELQSKAQYRKEKMNKFNYKFNNKFKSNNIDEIEKEPAYKRMGVELDKTISSSDTNQSKTTLSVDENNDLQFRSNNSFLHDNVD